MNSDKHYLKYTWFVLIMVFLVIMAGGVVRMTQSGMGCPDWPRCFGRWIPPVNETQLPADYEKYLRVQDIDHSFNVYHTWIEYINRLLGALLGIFIFIHFIWSFIRYRRTNRAVVFISFLLLIAVGFQGWLGKKVVDANLAVLKVTLHMLVALLIAALPVLIITKIKKDKIPAGRSLKNFSLIVLFLLLIQIISGTDVREQIDEIAKPLQYTQRELWIGQLNRFFLFHRSFSWFVAAGCIYLCWRSYSLQGLKQYSVLILSFISFSAVTGSVMYFLNIPAIVQPLHLLSASMLAITIFSFRLKLK